MTVALGITPCNSLAKEHAEVISNANPGAIPSPDSPAISSSFRISGECHNHQAVLLRERTTRVEGRLQDDGAVRTGSEVEPVVANAVLLQQVAEL